MTASGKRFCSSPTKQLFYLEFLVSNCHRKRPFCQFLTKVYSTKMRGWINGQERCSCTELWCYYLHKKTCKHTPSNKLVTPVTVDQLRPAADPIKIFLRSQLATASTCHDPNSHPTHQRTPPFGSRPIRFLCKQHYEVRGNDSKKLSTGSEPLIPMSKVSVLASFHARASV